MNLGEYSNSTNINQSDEPDKLHNFTLCIEEDALQTRRL